MLAPCARPRPSRPLQSAPCLASGARRLLRARRSRVTWRRGYVDEIGRYARKGAHRFDVCRRELLRNIRLWLAIESA